MMSPRLAQMALTFASGDAPMGTISRTSHGPEPSHGLSLSEQIADETRFKVSITEECKRENVGPCEGAKRRAMAKQEQLSQFYFHVSLGGRQGPMLGISLNMILCNHRDQRNTSSQTACVLPRQTRIGQAAWVWRWFHGRYYQLCKPLELA